MMIPFIKNPLFPLLLSLMLAAPAQAADVVDTLVLRDITAIAAGNDHTCAVTVNGGVKCWGDNQYHQIANVSAPSRALPADVPGLGGMADDKRVTGIAAGGNHTCALTAKGGVKCWGDMPGPYESPVAVAMPLTYIESGVLAIATGWNHACALTSKRGVKCWGSNTAHQLGDGSNSDSLNSPVDVAGLSGANGEPAVLAISAGRNRSCALSADGAVKCWGDYLNTVPVNVTGLVADVAAISGACALTKTGSVKCFSNNRDGADIYYGYGYGYRAQDVSGFAGAPNDESASLIANGVDHSCLISSQGVLKCWGSNASGQLGDGTTIDHATPMAVVDDGGKPQIGWTALALGAKHTCALATDGGVKCWGHRESGRIGDHTRPQSLSAVAVDGLNAAAQSISAGETHSCAVTIGGKAWCWGDNSFGQLGDNSTMASRNPIMVKGLLSSVQAIATGRGGSACDPLGESIGIVQRGHQFYPYVCGGAHTCLLTAQGAMMCWGDNRLGQLGDASNNKRLAPVAVSGLAGKTIGGMALGEAHSCALTSQGAVYCWGNNTWGQLGDGTNTGRNIPGLVSGLEADVVAISSAKFRTCALTKTGIVKCWGLSFEVGHNVASTYLVPYTIPVQPENLILDAGTHVLAIAAGDDNNCALTSQGKVLCWSAPRIDCYFRCKPPGDLIPPVEIAGITEDAGESVDAIDAGGAHHCAHTTRGRVKCWGQNDLGQLGNGATGNSQQAVQVLDLQTGAHSLASGLNHNCVINDAGLVKCWGNNRHGQLGDGKDRYQRTPVNVAAGTKPQSGWWWNPAEGGRGFSIEEQDGKIFMAGYLYEQSGRATWYAAGPTAMRGNRLVSRLTEYRGGQTLNGAFQPPSGNKEIGDISIDFTGPADATVTWPGGTLQLVHYDIVPGGSDAQIPVGTPESGWWWNPDEGGRGFTIEVQNGSMFLGGYMYDDAGNPVWYVSGPAKMQDGKYYSGTLQQYGNGQAIGAPWVPAQVINQNVGEVFLNFSDGKSAYLRLPNGKTIKIQRYQF